MNPDRTPRGAPQVDELALAPTPTQERLLVETMIRVNAAADAVAGVGFAAIVSDPDDLAAAAGDELARFELPVVLRRCAVARAARELRSVTRKPKVARFAAVLYTDTVQWPAPDRARLVTLKGRREVQVAPDRSYGWLRSPLEGRPVSLQRRGERFVLVAEDRTDEE